MKSRYFPITALLGVGVAWALFLPGQPWAAAPAGTAAVEYATLRWDGPENTHVIRPDGSVQSAGPQLREVRVPARTDARAFYMNLLLNALAREGFELADAANPDVYVVRRTVR